MADDSTVVLTDIESALGQTDEEAKNLPPALVVVGGDLNGTIFDLSQNEVTVGRSEDNVVTLEFNGISRHHFKVSMNGDTATVQDTGSKNGTFVNNQKIEGAVTLNRGDMIKIGSMALKYLPKGDPERLTYEKLNMEANTDKHTGCFNKAYFNNQLDKEVKNSKVSGNPLTLIIFDLDHFKKLNDGFGHDAGDFVLKEVSALIRKEGVRDGDTFARYGGEEFCILLPKTNLKAGFDIAERLRKMVAGYDFMYEGNKLPVSASIGIADYRQGVNTGTDLFKRADQAVYASKEGGRNQSNFYRE